MTDTTLVIPDQHAHPDYNNDRADYLGKFIADLKPDVVINLGDGADLPSLSSYDKGKASFHGRNYQADIDAHLDFQDRLWSPIRKLKKKLPFRVYLEGNHEHRIKKALEYSPELEGEKFGMSFKDLDLDYYYNVSVEYDGGTPGVFQYDGVNYAHFFVSGLMGRPIGGENHAASLIKKQFASCTCGHSHTADFAIRTDTHGKKLLGLVAGVYQDYDSPWAGSVNRLWWDGVVVKRNVQDGVYDPQFVSLHSLREAYG